MTGASGLIGSAVRRALEERGDKVVALSRSGNTPSWDPSNGIINGSLEGFDAVINLAGESIGSGRWNAAKKTAIRDSRIKGTQALAQALAKCDRKPNVLISGSAVGYYGSRGREELLDEQSSPAHDFLASLCQEWEAATRPAGDAGIRVASLRTGLVLSPDGGALKNMLLPFKLGVGGKIGSGRQYMSWISLADEVRAILFVLDHADISGPVNLTAPHPVTNEVFTKLLGEALHRPAIMPLPSRVLKLIFGSELATELLLQGQRVFPKQLERSGCAFEHVTLEAAFRSLFS